MLARITPVLVSLTAALLLPGCDKPTAPPPDVAPPVVQISSPVRDTTLDSLTVMLSGTLSDSVGVSRATYAINQGVEQQLAITPGATVSFSTRITLEPGPNAVTVHAFDAAGNKGVATVGGVVVDTVSPPNLRLISPEDGARVRWEDFHGIGLYGFAGWGDSIRVTYSLNGGPERQAYYVYRSNCGQPCFQERVTGPFRAGPNELAVHAYGRTGKRTSKRVTIYSVPNATFSTPKPYSTVNTNPVRVEGTAIYGAPIVRVTFRVNDGPEQDILITAGLSVPFSFLAPLATGDNSINVIAYDATGRPGQASLSGIRYAS